MTRSIDQPIPADERLFHALLADEVANEMILHLALQMDGWIPRCSVWRQKYLAAPGDALKGKPGLIYVHLAVTRPRHLPPDVEVEVRNPNPRKSPQRRAYRFKAVDDPQPEDDAHAEIRATRVEDGVVKVNSETAQNTLRVELAARFRIFGEDEW